MDTQTGQLYRPEEVATAVQAHPNRLVAITEAEYALLEGKNRAERRREARKRGLFGRRRLLPAAVAPQEAP